MSTRRRIDVGGGPWIDNSAASAIRLPVAKACLKAELWLTLAQTE